MTTIIDSKKLVSLKYVVIVSVLFFFGIMLIVNYEICKSSILHGLYLCSQTLIPSLFPFMFLASFITNSGLLESSSEFLNRITYKTSGLPYCSVAVFILSAIGGFPVGPRMVKELYENKSITENQANRLLLFCINPSPAFAINTLGVSLFSSKKTGIIIYLSVVLSNVILSLFTKCLDDKKTAEAPERKPVKISSSFVKAGNDASSAMIKICAYVILFSAFISLIASFIENQHILNFFYGLTEVTLGCEVLSKLNNIPLIAGIIAWSGIAVHFQIMDCIETTHTDLRLFFTSRIVSASISVIICDALLKRFPVQASAISQTADVRIATNETSLPVSIAMLLTCFLFLVGDYTINSRIKKHKNVETGEII